jgi:hypothetical protein
MRESTRIFGISTDRYLWPKVLLLCVFVAIAISCKDKPSVVKSFRCQSPDGKWEAVIERVDNGLGFGLGALYDEVHLVESGKSISQHGDPCSNVLFYRDSSTESELTTQVTWLDSRRLQIRYPANPKPGRALAEYHSFSVILIPIAPTTK